MRNQDYGRLEYRAIESQFCSHDDHDYDHDRNRNGDHDRDYGPNHRRTAGHFKATSITSVTFSDDPGFQPGRAFGAPRPTVDSVTFAGKGTWNGKRGFTFEVTATDQGEPGRGRDTFTLIVKDSRGEIVANVNGDLDGGNVQSTRLGILSSLRGLPSR